MPSKQIPNLMVPAKPSHRCRPFSHSLASGGPRLLVAAALLLLIPGCWGSAGPERIVVIGTVTLDDVAIPAGKVWFVPAEGQDLPQAGGTIETGIYRIENKGGVPLGKHKVKIFGERPVQDARITQDGGPEQIPMEQFVPPRFNTETELTAVIERGEAPLVLDFVLQSKK